MRENEKREENQIAACLRLYVSRSPSLEHMHTYMYTWLPPDWKYTLSIKFTSSSWSSSATRRQNCVHVCTFHSGNICFTCRDDRHFKNLNRTRHRQRICPKQNVVYYVSVLFKESCIVGKDLQEWSCGIEPDISIKNGPFEPLQR